jgi:hypothetical protein
VEVYPEARSLQQDNLERHISHAYQIHISHKITQLKQLNEHKNKKNSSQSYTNYEGHIRPNECSVEKEKK